MSAGHREGGSERCGSDLRPTPRPRYPRCLRPLRSPARRSPAPRQERPERAGRGLRRLGALDLGRGRATVAGGRRGQGRGPEAASPPASKFLAGVAGPPLCAPSNGPRAAGPGQTRGTGGVGGTGRELRSGDPAPLQQQTRAPLPAREWGEQRLFPAVATPRPGGAQEEPLSRLSQKGGKRWGCEGTRRPEVAH